MHTAIILHEMDESQAQNLMKVINNKESIDNYLISLGHLKAGFIHFVSLPTSPSQFPGTSL